MQWWNHDATFSNADTFWGFVVRFQTPQQVFGVFLYVAAWPHVNSERDLSCTGVSWQDLLFTTKAFAIKSKSKGFIWLRSRPTPSQVFTVLEIVCHQFPPNVLVMLSIRLSTLNSCCFVLTTAWFLLRLRWASCCFEPRGSRHQRASEAKPSLKLSYLVGHTSPRPFIGRSLSNTPHSPFTISLIRLMGVMLSMCIKVRSTYRVKTGSLSIIICTRKQRFLS